MNFLTRDICDFKHGPRIWNELECFSPRSFSPSFPHSLRFAPFVDLRNLDWGAILNHGWWRGEWDSFIVASTTPFYSPDALVLLFYKGVILLWLLTDVTASDEQRFTCSAPLLGLLCLFMEFSRILPLYLNSI